MKGDLIMSTQNRNAETMRISMEGMTLRVADVERSLAFYQIIAGVEVVVHRSGEFALLFIGKGLLGLLKYGATHVEFGTSDVDGLYQHLKGAGYRVDCSHSLQQLGALPF